jgi:hypothetical protein
VNINNSSGKVLKESTAVVSELMTAGYAAVVFLVCSSEIII